MKAPKFRSRYPMVLELMASATEPMPWKERQTSVDAINDGIKSMELDERPSLQAWRAVSDGVNILQSLVELGYCEDTTGFLHDCMVSMGAAGRRYLDGKRLGLDGQGVRNLKELLELYAEVIGSISHRQFIRAVRHTERRIFEIHYGIRKTEGDVVCI